ncbi:MAG: glycosyltransferase [Oscillospiraceae bacterium]|nr:glycosyltransferase [Oscillospiraceae bacterium]
MNIAIITDSFPPMIDGVSRCALGYAQALHDGGYGNIIVITPKIPGLKYDYPFPVYGFPSVSIHYSHYRAGHPFIPYLVRKLKKMDIDIIHAHSPFTSMLLARQLRRFLDIPIVFTQHTKWHYDIAQAVSSKALRREIERYAYINIRAADEVWAVSKGAGEYLKSRGFKGGYVVMPSGSEVIATTAESSAKTSIREKFSLPDGVPVLLFVGRMMWYKGIALQLDALKLLRERGFMFRMIFVGDGDDLDDIKIKVADYGLDDCVCFAGRVTDRAELMGYYCVADLLLFLSTYDTQGLVVQEAAAASCPALVPSESAPAEFLEDMVTGFITESNPALVADKIESIFSDRDHLRTVGKMASEHVYIPWERAIVKVADRYRELTKEYNKNLRKTVRVKIKRTVKYRLIKVARAGKQGGAKLRLKVIGR